MEMYWTKYNFQNCKQITDKPNNFCALKETAHDLYRFTPNIQNTIFTFENSFDLCEYIFMLLISVLFWRFTRKHKLRI